MTGGEKWDWGKARKRERSKFNRMSEKKKNAREVIRKEKKRSTERI